MKRNMLPSDHLDIILPVLSYTQIKTAEAFPGKQVGAWDTKLYLMTKETSLSCKKAAEIIGCYFRREFRYDFPPYVPGDRDARNRVFLFTHIDEMDWDMRRVVGAIGFNWRKYSDAPGQLVLSWVWIHPFLRRQGLLTAYWEVFRKLYGDFHVEPPLSKAMESFLKKMKAVAG